MDEAKAGIKLTNKMYDTVHHLVIYVLPALGAFYFTIAGIWDLPYAEQVVGSIAALATLLGIVLGLSRRVYKSDDSNFDGALVVDSAQNIMRLEPETPLYKLADQKTITLKVKQAPGELESMHTEVGPAVSEDIPPSQ